MISKLTMKRFLALSAASIVCVAMARPAAQAQESAQQQIATEEQTATGQEPLLERQTAAETLVRALSLEFQHQQVGTHSLGVTVVPVDATLRAQLALSPDQGLVVLNVDADSPASEAGVAQHDVLLRLGDMTLTNPADFGKQVDAVGEHPVDVQAIRRGESVTLRLTPRPTARLAVTFPTELTATGLPRFWIGVELAEADEALRAQLNLPADQGVAVNNVIDDSPAAKAGLKQHDVLVQLGETPIAGAEAFRDSLQQVGERPVAIKLFREGKPISIEVTPQQRVEPRLHEIVLEGQTLSVDFLRPAAIPVEIGWSEARISVDQGLPHERLQKLIEQVKEIQAQLEALQGDLENRDVKE